MRLKNKTALITGGNSGIGLETARLFVAEGAKIIITGRNRETLDAAAKELGPNATALVADATDVAATEAAINPEIEAKAKTIPRRNIRHLSIRALLQPHWAALTVGFLAVIGEGAANLLEPWPLKVVLDNVLRCKDTHPGFMRWVEGYVGTDKLSILKFA